MIIISPVLSHALLAIKSPVNRITLEAECHKQEFTPEWYILKRVSKPVTKGGHSFKRKWSRVDVLAGPKKRQWWGLFDMWGFFLVLFCSKVPGHDVGSNDRILCRSCVCYIWVKDLFVWWWPVMDREKYRCLLKKKNQNIIPTPSNWMVHCCMLHIITTSLCSLCVDICAQGSLWTLKMLSSPLRPNSYCAAKDIERQLRHFQGCCRTEPGWRLLRKGPRAVLLERGQERASHNVTPRYKGMIGSTIFLFLIFSGYVHFTTLCLKMFPACF